MQTAHGHRPTWKHNLNPPPVWTPSNCTVMLLLSTIWQKSVAMLPHAAEVASKVCEAHCEAATDVCSEGLLMWAAVRVTKSC